MSLPKTAPRRKPLPKTTAALPKTAPAASSPLPKTRSRAAVVERGLAAAVATARKTVEQQFTGAEKIDGAAVVYQQERVNCGKHACKACRAGGGHGPYWYAYWTTFGRTRSLYIGKELRSVAETLDKRAAAREASNV